jgi:hypothetical protein
MIYEPGKRFLLYLLQFGVPGGLRHFKSEYWGYGNHRLDFSNRRNQQNLYGIP